MTTDAVGGVWRYTIDLVEELSARGIECIVAVVGPPPQPAQAAELQGHPGVRMVNTAAALDWTATPDELAAGQERLVSLAGILGVRAVHLHAPALMGTRPWPAPVVAVCHSCMATWWQAMRSGPPPADFIWRIAATADGLQRAAAVIAPSHAHAAAMRAAYGPMDIAVVHNGVVPSVLVAGARRRRVLAAGRLWDEAKGMAALDAAADALEAPVRVAGEVAGPNGSVFAPRHLLVLGRLTRGELAGEYAQARVFASLARYEPFGLAVLEAAQAGCRLVLADTPVFRELWDGAADFVGEDVTATLRHALDAGDDGGAQARAQRYGIAATAEATLRVHEKAAESMAGARA